jgi:capsular exopolysaccharide synthesis family protein
MSRFYDALRHASRPHLSGNGDAEAHPWASFGINPVTVAPVELVAEEAADGAEEIMDAVAAGAGVSAPPPPRRDPWTIITEPKNGNIMRAVSSPGDVGTDAQINIDRKVRALPNVANDAVIENYRRLRTKLMQQHAARPFRSVLVTSAQPEEGKTVTTLNLALSFAMLPGFRVLVVDGDLRRGTMAKWLRVTDRPGLSNLIEKSVTVHDVLLRCDQMPVHFITSGNATTPAAELLHAPQLGELFRNISEQFDLVLVDSPPVNVITDTQLLASHCDAVLVVARAYSTKSKALERAVQDLSGFRILGAVLNGGLPVSSYGKYGGYY